MQMINSCNITILVRAWMQYGRADLTTSILKLKQKVTIDVILETLPECNDLPRLSENYASALR